jgi:hypothetical protein
MRGPLFICLVLLLAAPAAAAPPGFGAGGGVFIPLDPTDTVGGAVTVTAFARGDPEGPMGMLAMRGELVGLVSEDSKGILPTLVGEANLDLSRVNLGFFVGVQMFGFTWRGDYTMFATFGLVGGAGVMFRLTRALSLGLRSSVIYLPPFALAKIEGPDNEDRPTLGFVTGTLVFEYTFDQPGRQEPTLMAPPVLD